MRNLIVAITLAAFPVGLYCFVFQGKQLTTESQNKNYTAVIEYHSINFKPLAPVRINLKNNTSSDINVIIPTCGFRSYEIKNVRTNQLVAPGKKLSQSCTTEAVPDLRIPPNGSITINTSINLNTLSFGSYLIDIRPLDIKSGIEFFAEPFKITYLPLFT